MIANFKAAGRVKTDKYALVRNQELKMQDKKLEVLDHAAGVADDLIARALVIVQQVQSGKKSTLCLASAVGHLASASDLLKAHRRARDQ